MCIWVALGAAGMEYKGALMEYLEDLWNTMKRRSFEAFMGYQESALWNLKKLNGISIRFFLRIPRIDAVYLDLN